MKSLKILAMVFILVWIHTFTRNILAGFSEGYKTERWALLLIKHAMHTNSHDNIVTNVITWIFQNFREGSYVTKIFSGFQSRASTRSARTHVLETYHKKACKIKGTVYVFTVVPGWNIWCIRTFTIIIPRNVIHMNFSDFRETLNKMAKKFFFPCSGHKLFGSTCKA